MAYGTTYYVDGGGSDTAPYDTWAKAANALATVVAIAVAGDVCYCSGTEQPGSTVAFGTSGSIGSGWITFIGCTHVDEATTVDGTKFVIDADNSTLASCISSNSDYIRIENFEFWGGSSHGVNLGASADWWIFVNCISRNNDGEGFGASGGPDEGFWIKCQAYSNGGDGFNLGFRDFLFGCVARDNGDEGFIISSNSDVVGCISDDNTGYGYQLSAGSNMFNCIANNEATGIYMNSEESAIIGCRITNCTTGIDFNTSQWALCGWNIIHNSGTADLANPAAWSEEGVTAAYIKDEDEVNTNKIDPDIDDGYINEGTNDYNLKASRTYNGETDDAIDINYG